MMPRISLGSILAFLAPGALLLVALSFHVPQVADLLASVTTASSGLGPIAAILMACLSLGVVLNGCRSVLVDWVWYSPKWRNPLNRPADVLGILASREQLEAYESMLENMFRFYLFYANVALALAMAGLSFLAMPGQADLSITAAAAVVALILIMMIAARNSLADFSRATYALLEHRPEPNIEGRRGRRSEGAEGMGGGAGVMAAGGHRALDEEDIPDDILPAEYPRPGRSD
jgi:hypothetical protein